MIINDILNKYNIKIDDNENYLEYLQKNRKNNFFYIDRFPLPCGDKFDQVEINFHFVLNKNINIEEYEKIENLYLNILEKLWVYNKVYINIDYNIDIIKKYKKYIPEIFRNKLFELYKNDFTKEISNIDLFKLIALLSVRELVGSEIYFEDFKIIVIPTFSCSIIYFLDLEYLDMVEKIINVEGLYLRKY